MRSFVKIKSSRSGEIILSFTDIHNHAIVAIFYAPNMSFNAIPENKILAKISEFTVSRSLTRSFILKNPDRTLTK